MVDTLPERVLYGLALFVVFMTISTIYIARHGYRMNWLPPPHPPNPTGIDSDPPLAPHGVEQAKELASFIASLPPNERPQFILSSPFYRCVETGQPISETLNIPIALERGVGEWYKVGRGIIPEPANYDTLNRFFSHLSSADEWDRDNTVGVIPSLNGETEDQIFQRCQEFWTKFIPIFEQKYPEISSILIITHAATKIALGMSLLGYNNVFEYLDDDKTVLRAAACSLDKYKKISNSKWSLEMNGNCEFLTDGEEMNWNFHYGFEAGSDEDIKARQLAIESEKAESEKGKGTKAENEKEIDPSELEDFYVTIDLPRFGDESDVIRPSSTLQISNIIEDNPLMRLINKDFEDNMVVNNLSFANEQVLQLKWSKLIGNDLIFDEHGDLVANVKEHLSWDHTKKFTEIKTQEQEKVKTESTGMDNKTQFYRQMVMKLEENEGAKMQVDDTD